MSNRLLPSTQIQDNPKKITQNKEAVLYLQRFMPSTRNSPLTGQHPIFKTPVCIPFEKKRFSRTVFFKKCVQKRSPVLTIASSNIVSSSARCPVLVIFKNQKYCAVNTLPGKQDKILKSELYCHRICLLKLWFCILQHYYSNEFT